MASPANPFTALHQKDGSVASAPTRGRGGPFNRPTHYQSRGANTNVPRGRGRGRGIPAPTRVSRGNARGAGSPGNTWRSNKPEAQAGSTGSTGSTASPFAQPTQNHHPFPFAAGQNPQRGSPFSGIGRGRGRGSAQSFGAASNRNGTSVDLGRDPRKRPFANPTNGVAAATAPVEDASTMSSYNDRYEKLKVARAKQREQAIRAGQMADPNQPMSLKKAITPVGTCTSMCPEFERVERIVQKMVDKSEKYLHPATNSLQNMEAKMLKRFRRSAAGYDEQLPSDIRTPRTLLQTMNYLTRHVIGGPEPLGLIHKFVWDRTRSIRNDFSVQQVTQEMDVKIAVKCLERIARFHIVSLHLLSSPANEEPFDRHQEREQLNNTMLSLMYYYDDNRDRISFPNEDEFRAYYIIFSIHDQRPDLEARVQKWPPELRNAPRVQIALELFAAAGNTWEYQGTLDAKRPNAIAQGFYARFFGLIDSPGVSYLMACVAEIYFNHMRQTAIRSIWKGYCRYPLSQQHKNEEWTVDKLTSVLCFDDPDQTIRFCEAQGLEFAENADGDLYLNWGSRPVDSVAFQPSSDHSFSEHYVESKRAGRSLVAIVLGLNVREAAVLGMIDIALLSERGATITAENMTPDNDDSLFVSDDDNEMSISMPQSPKATNMSYEPLADTSGSTIFGNISQRSSGSLPGSTPGLSFPQSSSAFQPPASSHPFSSPLSTSNSTATPSTPPLNPFAKPFSPFATGQTSKPPAFSLTPANENNGQSSSIFSSTGNFAQSTGSDKAPTTSASSPLQFPSASQPTTSQATISQTTTSQGTPFSLFQNIQKPMTSQASPFSAPQASLSVKPSQPSDSTAGQSTASIFETAKLATTPESKTPILNFGTTPDSVTQKPQTITPEPPKEQPPAESPQVSSSFGQTKSETPSVFSTAQDPPEPLNAASGASSFFSAPQKPPAQSNATFGAPSNFSTAQKSSEPVNAASGTPSVFSTTEIPPVQWTATSDAFIKLPAPETSPNLSTSQAIISDKEETSKATPIVQNTTPSPGNSALEQPLPRSPQNVDKAKPVAPAEPLANAQSNVPELDSPAPAETVGEEQSSEETKKAEAERNEAEHQLAWANALREAANRRRKTASTPTSRKRVFEEQETIPTESVVKAPKVSKPEPPPRKSMALSSIKPLPKLPILEAIEAMTTRKPVEKKPEPPKSSQVDEDEILLSAARIAAESLRSGPRLLDGYSTSYEPWRSSFSPGSSVVSSVAFSRSQSPQQSSVNGYDVALAPDNDLGLGHTLSRTEQRIRLTGGKGLAYKPLNFTPGKSQRTPPKK